MVYTSADAARGVREEAMLSQNEKIAARLIDHALNLEIEADALRADAERFTRRANSIQDRVLHLRRLARQIVDMLPSQYNRQSLDLNTDGVTSPDSMKSPTTRETLMVERQTDVPYETNYPILEPPFRNKT